MEEALSNNLRPFLFLDYLRLAAFHSNFHPEAMQLFIIERLCGCALRLHVRQETLNGFVALAQVANREDPLRSTSSTGRSTRPTLKSAWRVRSMLLPWRRRRHQNGSTYPFSAIRVVFVHHGVCRGHCCAPVSVDGVLSTSMSKRCVTDQLE